MNNTKLYKLADAAEITGLSKPSLLSYARTGKIKSIMTPGGRRRYDISTLILVPEKENNYNVCYCRVSTNNQKDDLQRQVAYMSSKYPTYEIITDIGSGINFKRPGLKKIIKYAISNSLRNLVVAYKDRLCRIGYDLIEHILIDYSDTNIIIDSQKKETINEEIANDILQIITVYSAKINGMRSYSI